MLGRAFESLMASRERRTSGAFYTPQVLVAHVAEAALSSRLVEGGVPTAVVESVLRGETPSAPVRPACGRRSHR